MHSIRGACCFSSSLHTGVFVFETVHCLSLPFQEYAFLVRGILYPPAQADYEQPYTDSLCGAEWQGRGGGRVSLPIPILPSMCLFTDGGLDMAFYVISIA